ncbi:MAG: putative DNA binding domain-containing protein [Muribaculaceae bacterium]|nr:putative DNA binding domain-containing protein [Muribaculaceae bacterium]
MSPTSQFSLELLATYKENSRLEVKSARGGLPNSLWESYSAFANSEGGIIVLGCKEGKDGKFMIEGLDDAHKLLKDFWNLVNNRQKVSSNILTDSMVYIDIFEGRELIVINVPRAERTSRPVYVGTDPRTGTYRRNGEGDYHCSLEEVALMIRDSALVTDDNKLLTNLDMSVFCQDTIRAYRNIFKLVRQNHLWNNEDDAMFLRRIGAVREDKRTGKFHPTVAGLLMFGYEYEITPIFPNYFLDYEENRTNGIYARWTDRITSQSGDWSGNVFDFILKVIPRLQADFKVPFVFRGNVRDEDTPLHKTVREATVNMVANADFYGRRGVVVLKGADGFRFANPGSMRVSLKEVIQDSASDPRNGVMMKMLALVEYGERAGSGLQGIFKTWERVYHCSPKLEVSTTDGIERTTLSLNFEGNQPDIEAMKQLYGNIGEKNEVSTKLNEIDDVAQNVAPSEDKVASNVAPNTDNVAPNKDDVALSLDERILQIIKLNPSIRREDIATQLSVNKKTIERHLKDLCVKWEGHSKTGHWITLSSNYRK